ncbi:hypothetical protein V1506DRAFT_527048 [Lipomyces tetrasporus]
MAHPVLLDQLLRERTAALLQSATDYRRYARHLSSRLHRLRKTLKVRRRVPAKARKSTSAVPADTLTSKYKTHVPSAPELNTDKRFAGILLLAAERAWAHAMESKATMENNAAGAPERKRHILSRLEKARKYAAALQSILLDDNMSVTSFTDYEKLQVVTYVSVIMATGDLESRNYEKAVASFAVAYTGLSGLVLNFSTTDASDDDNDMADLYRDLLSSTVEPALKFSAIQVDSSSRSVAVLALARKYLPTSPVDKLVSSVAKDETKAKELLSGKSEAVEALSTMPTIRWRSHTAQLRDASVAAAILAARTADDTLLSDVLSPSGDAAKNLSSRDKALRFDPALLAWQDAVDAVHDAIAEVTNSSIDGAQERIQELYIVSTYANYNLISRRIARDNVLASQLRSTLSKKQKKESTPRSAVSKSVAGNVRAITGIYDSILQSISQIVELPGVAADEALSNALSSLQKYYTSLRLGIAAAGYPQASVDASIYWKKAVDEINDVDEIALNLDLDDTEDDYNTKILFTVDVPGTRKLLTSGAATSQSYSEQAKISEEAILEAQRNKGSQPFVIDTLTSAAMWIDKQTGKTKVVDMERLVDLESMARLTPVPAKPVFFDTAFNFIGYEDGIEKEATASAAAAANASGEPETPTAAQPEEKKAGWFWRR